MKEALLYKRLENKLVQCYLCSHNCKINNQRFGLCQVRQNIDGILYTHSYGKIIAAHIDPIEKKPLYHFLPGSRSFSIATAGCNFRCGFCQNWEISQRSPDNSAALAEEQMSPEEIVEEAILNKCSSISYTYTEPTIFFEYAFDIAKLAKQKGLFNNFVTNGYMSGESLKMIRPCLDAANVDLKFFRDDSYRRLCGATLKPVLNSIKLMKELGIWVEVTTLVIPGENDSEEELGDIANFISGIDKDIPWHISRFHPDYKLTDRDSTSEVILKNAQKIAFEFGLRFVYIGNVSGWGNDTYCPNCKKLLIKREVFDIYDYNIKEGNCIFCNTRIAGVFS